MKTTDNLIPYLLMGMHPLHHITKLVAGAILLTTSPNFYNILGPCFPSKAHDFIEETKYTLMRKAMVAHAAALFLHWMYAVLHYFDSKADKVFSMLCLIVKIPVFFVIILQIQAGIDFTYCVDVINHSQVMAWLTYEVCLFYVNLISLSAFILIQNCAKFKSIQDRVGLAGKNARKEKDFLNYAKDDIHWWSAWFNQYVMAILALLLRTASMTAGLDIKPSAGTLFLKHFFAALIIGKLYVTGMRIRRDFVTIILLISTFTLNTLQVFQYVELAAMNSKWWGTFILIDIVLYYTVFLQMAISIYVWPMKMLKWRRQLMIE